MISYEYKEGIAKVCLNRPKQINALHPVMVKQLIECFNKLEKTDELVAVFLEGSGEKGFCSGADMKYMESCTNVELNSYFTSLNNLSKRLYHLKVPLITFIHGHVYGYGGVFVSLSDRVIATENLRLGFPEIKHGKFPMLVYPPLVRSIGKRKAKELLYSGRIINSVQALQNGLVHEIVKNEEKTSVYNNIFSEVIEQLVGYKYGAKAIAMIEKMGLEDSLDVLTEVLLDNYKEVQIKK